MFVSPLTWYLSPSLEENGTTIVNKCFSNYVVLDPSCFWSKEKFDYILGIKDKFNPTFIIPNKILKFVKERKKKEFINFMTKYWEGRKKELEEFWPFLLDYFPQLKTTGSSKNKERHNTLLSILKKTFPVEGEVVYEVVESSFSSMSFIVGFGRSDPPFWKKLERKVGFLGTKAKPEYILKKLKGKWVNLIKVR